MSIKDIPNTLIEAVQDVIWPGFRRDLDIRPLYLLGGLCKRLGLSEIYQGASPNQFYTNLVEQERIHDTLRINNINDSLTHYSKEGSIEINNALWNNHINGHTIPSHIQSHIQNIDSLLKSRTETGPIKLYTGIPKSPVALAGFQWNSNRSKKLISFPSYTSTSTSFDVAAKFTMPDVESVHHESDHHGIILPNSRHVIELNFDDGILDAASLHHHSDSDEKEIILGRHHEFELDPRPHEIKGFGYYHPVYVWRAKKGAVHINKERYKNE